MKLLTQEDLKPLVQADPNQMIYSIDSYFKPIRKILFRKRLKMVLKLMGNKEYQNFLDIGLGSGIFLPELSSRTKKLTATDTHKNIEVVKNIINSKNISANLLKADVRQMPFEDNSFDGILCLSVLEFVSDINQAIKEIKRVARPKAKIIIGIPVFNPITDLCYKMIGYKKYADSFHKSNHQIIIKAIKENLSIKKIKTYPFFLPVNLSLFVALEATKVDFN